MSLVAYCKWSYLTDSLPTGITPGNLEALYKFDQKTVGLTDRSTGGHNLTLNGGIDLYTPTEVSLGVAGMELRNDRYAYGPTGLYPGTTGACTLEALWTPGPWTVADDVIFSIIGVTGSGLEAENCVFELQVDSEGPRGQYLFRHEYGAGNWESLSSGWSSSMHCPTLVTVTRAADGKTYKLHINGEYLVTKVATNAVTDGGSPSSSQRIRVGGYGSGNDLYGTVHSIRYTKEEFSAAQVLEAYEACRVTCGGEGATGVLVVERNWPGKAYGARASFPPWHAVGRRRVAEEDQE
jgi:hypothetical protein